MKTIWALFLLISALYLACLLSGCAQMGTKQKDSSTTTRIDLDENGATNSITTEVRETSTQASGKSLISASSTFEGLDIGQNGADQGMRLKKAAQKSDGMAQLVESVRALRDIGAMMYGFPPAQSAAQSPSAPPPAGMKWILAPVDNPSAPHPESQ